MTQGPTFLTGGNRTSLVGAFTTTPFTTSGLATCNGSNDPNGSLALCEDQFGADRLFESGVITNNNRDWTGIDGNAGGAPMSNLGIHQEDRSKTDDISINVKWRPADQWFVNLDAHKTTAEFERTRLWAGSRFFSDFYFVPDIDNPRVALIPDPTGAVSPGFRAGTDIPAGDPANVADPDNAYLLFAADEFQENEGDLYAVSGDVEYEFANDGWFDSVKFGARYAEREQINRSAGLNWAAVSPPWAGGYAPYSGLDDPSNFEAVEFGDFFRGGAVIGENTQVIFPDRGLLSNYDAFASFIATDSLIQSTGTDWSPLRVDGVIDYANRGQIGDVTEKTQNFYARLDFGNEFANGMSIDGNVGVRYTGTEVIGNGSLRFNEVVENGTPGQLPSDFSPEAVAYFTQASIDQSGTLQEDNRFLPSLNVKWNLNDNSLIRFGVSDAITRPNIAQLRSDQVAVGNFRFISTDDLTVPADERIEDIQLSQISVFGGNPDLKPIESRNWDISYENYYGDNNSFSFALFRKDLVNNIIYGSKTLDTVTLDGRPVPIVFNGDLNQDEATIQGAEIAFLHFFDELPGLFGNFGVQANYTYIDAETNAPLPIVDADGDGAPDSFEQILRFGVNDFLGLSEGAANLIGIYQDDKIEARLAYNWRSDYLSSYRDFITGNPIYQEERGYLDGSFKYDFNDNFQFRAQIANILDTQAIASQQVDQNGQRFGRSNFIGDRRIKVGVRYSY